MTVKKVSHMATTYKNKNVIILIVTPYTMSTNFLKLICFCIIFFFIGLTGHNLFNTLNSYQLERINSINAILED